MKVADQVAEWLEAKDIRHSFGFIGGGNVALWDAIHRRGFTKLICVHHEQAASMAATYYYRTSGRLALCLVTTGAGACNALTGVLAAYMDSIPLLVISGNEPSSAILSPTRVKGVQGYDSADIGGRLGKMGQCVHEPSKTIPALNYAHTVALSRRHGPVWVDIPKDIQNAH